MATHCVTTVMMMMMMMVWIVMATRGGCRGECGKREMVIGRGRLSAEVSGRVPYQTYRQFTLKKNLHSLTRFKQTTADRRLDRQTRALWRTFYCVSQSVEDILTSGESKNKRVFTEYGCFSKGDEARFFMRGEERLNSI